MLFIRTTNFNYSKKLKKNSVKQPRIAIKPEHILLFDMDGTLVDTNLANFLAYKKAIQELFELEYFIPYNPYIRFNSNTLKRILPYLNQATYEKIALTKEKYYVEYLEKTKLNEEITNLLLRYSKTNTTILVTNSKRNRAILTLKYHGVLDKFSYCYFGQEVQTNTNNKYQNVIESLKILPQNIIVFEDEEEQIQNAIDAGIPQENIIQVIFKNLEI
ncbi:MAG: HAD hydrolase-like protein [Bacteroidia bacterium]|nr:HAD family hydrolase [Bacteroidia bacterium]MDW8157835.1 HAD hydrolase-like protein [Bacteroidia bacterium]